MARYSSKDLDIKIGGASIKAHVQDDITIGIEVGTEESTSYGPAGGSPHPVGADLGMTIGEYGQGKG